MVYSLTVTAIGNLFEYFPQIENFRPTKKKRTTEKIEIILHFFMCVCVCDFYDERAHTFYLKYNFPSNRFLQTN